MEIIDSLFEYFSYFWNGMFCGVGAGLIWAHHYDIAAAVFVMLLLIALHEIKVAIEKGFRELRSHN